MARRQGMASETLSLDPDRQRDCYFITHRHCPFFIGLYMHRESEESADLSGLAVFDVNLD
jgi:hypothetical protein